MRALIDDDLILGVVRSGDITAGTIEIPAALAAVPQDRLRFDGAEIIDAIGVTSWHADEFGRKRLASGPGRAGPLSCSWDAKLRRTSTGWAAQSPSDELRAYAAEKRWQVETGGCPWSVHVVATDRDSQGKLIAEFVAIGAGLRTDGAPWKMQSGGYVAMTNVQAAQMIAAARVHITLAFATEASVLAGIAAGTVTTLAQIDAAAWPPNV